MASENFLYACLLYVCYSMHAFLCVLFYVCYSMHAFLCVLFYACYSMCAILCVLFYACYYERYHNIVTMITTARMRILITHNIWLVPSTFSHTLVLYPSSIPHASLAVTIVHDQILEYHHRNDSCSYDEIYKYLSYF